MARSMTSFGRSNSEEGNKRFFTVEMKSVNNRYLDINVRLPKGFISLEDPIRKMISDSFSRGKIDVFVNLKSFSQGEGTPRVDIKLAEEYYRCLKQIEENLNVKSDISVMQIARFPEVITVVEEEDEINTIFEELKPLVTTAIKNMISMREVEGEKLKEDILGKINTIEVLVSDIEKISDIIPIQYKVKLEDRIRELLQGNEIDQNRMAMEVCMFADKYTIDEEITRLNSHISQVRKTLELKEPVGRKLDFIIQEMNRETNTIGSKSSDIKLTNMVIDIKNLLEKIREQIQNIE